MNFRANGVSLVEISSRLSSVRLVWCMFGRENQKELAQSGPRSSGRGEPRCVVLSFISEMYWSAFRSCHTKRSEACGGKATKRRVLSRRCPNCEPRVGAPRPKAKVLLNSTSFSHGRKSWPWLSWAKSGPSYRGIVPLR